VGGSSRETKAQRIKYHISVKRVLVQAGGAEQRREEKRREELLQWRFLGFATEHR
jgi:hypothetical protein